MKKGTLSLYIIPSQLLVSRLTRLSKARSAFARLR